MSHHITALIIAVDLIGSRVALGLRENWVMRPAHKHTGGLMLLYPVTTEMLQGLGAGAFAYSSGSSPKDIFSQGDQGNSPFDAGFTKALLQK
jgi:hypothetical protein